LNSSPPKTKKEDVKHSGACSRCCGQRVDLNDEFEAATVEVFGPKKGANGCQKPRQASAFDGSFIKI